MLTRLAAWLRPLRINPIHRRPACRPMLEVLEDRWAPAVLTVTSLADTTAPGTALTLRAAVMFVDGTLGRSLTAGEQASVSGTLGSSNTIQFNLPSGPQQITLTGGALSITKPVAIVGPGAASLTISGNGTDRVFYIGSGFSQNLGLSVSIAGLTIAGGKQQYGGGLFTSATLSLTNTTITGNTANNNGGGGIYNTGAITLSGCAFTSNTTLAGNDGATDGGALLNLTGGTASLTNCTFTGNTAPGTGATEGSAGAVANDGTITMTGCTFSGNSAASDAGAFYTDGTATIAFCTFTGNTCGADGGALHATGAITIANCLVAGNTAGSSGGGMEESSIVGSVPNKLTISDTTFANNTASGTAGGLVNWQSGTVLINSTFTGNRVVNGASGTYGGGIWAPGSITIENTIVAGNFQGSGTTPNDITGSVSSSSGYNLIGTGGSGGLQNGTNGNQVGVANPGLGTLANNGGPTQTIALLPGSPAIGAGNNAYVTAGATDQRGWPRIVNGSVDIGAFEVQSAPVPATTTFTISGAPGAITAGTATTFTVTALTATGSVATGYTGTVHFTSSDPKAVLPADYTFKTADNGTHTFSMTLNTAGTQSLTATDTATPGITATLAPITVYAATGVPTLYVNSTADTTSADNFLTLREAIALVDGTLGRPLTAGEQAQITGTPGPKAVIAFSLPAGTQTITLTGGALDITQPVTIDGPGAGSLTINGAGSDRDFIVGQIWSANPSLVVSINGLTIAGGSQQYGGGLLNFGTLTVTNTAFANNTASTSGGGGVYNVGTLMLNACSFTGNTVSTNDCAGGALDNISSGTATITNCTFTANTASGTGSAACSGGAIANSGSMTIAGSTFSSNVAASDGGAIYNDGSLTIGTSSFTNNTVASDGGAIRSGGTLTITACTFAGNSAASVGGALDSTDTTLSIVNSTFANNSAGSQGGAIMADPGTGTVSLINCTITANTASPGTPADGGGLYAGRSVTLDNTIVAGNFHGSVVADDIAGTVAAASAYNLIGTGGSGGLVNGVNHNLVGVANPGLGTLANNGGPTLTVALLSGSPAIGAGSNTFVTAGETDQRGQPRIANGTVDIGAFEVQTPPPPAPTPPPPPPPPGRHHHH